MSQEQSSAGRGPAPAHARRRRDWPWQSRGWCRWAPCAPNICCLCNGELDPITRLRCRACWHWMHLACNVQSNGWCMCHWREEDEGHPPPPLPGDGHEDDEEAPLNAAVEGTEPARSRSRTASRGGRRGDSNDKRQERAWTSAEAPGGSSSTGRTEVQTEVDKPERVALSAGSPKPEGEEATGASEE